MISVNSFAPIIIFAYNRPDALRQTFESLLKCHGVQNHEIIVFCDGPKNLKDKINTDEVVNYLNNQKETNNLTIVASEKNKGLANSVINGVNEVLKKHKALIVLEDDLVVASNFLEFMNQALDFYRDDKTIFSISGFSPKIKIPGNYDLDFYFSPRASSWGWATWKDRWQTVDWEVSSFPQFKKDVKKQIAFTKGGIDLPRMLQNQMKGKIDSWAIRWVYQQHLNQQATVYPTRSKLINVGINENATHTKKTNRFQTEIDTGEQTHFDFKKFNGYNQNILRSFRKVFSMWRRLKDKIF
jgi:hypothetical protein